MANLTCRILWWALVVSLVVYVVVAYVAEVAANPNAPVSLLLPVFVALSATTAVGSPSVFTTMVIEVLGNCG